jgi:hypothetical protein
MAYIGRQQDGFGVRSRFIYTATGGQTTFTTDNSSNALSYSDGAYVDVYLNGVLLDPSDYTATSLTSIVLDSGATASDILEVIVYDVFSVFSGTFTNGITASEAIVTGDLTVDTNTLFVDSTNNRVGVGTTSPSALLGVNGRLTLGDQASSGTAGAGSMIVGAGALFIQASENQNSSTKAPIVFSNIGGSSESMRIDSSGNLGIGTSSPACGLHVDNPDNGAITAILDTDNSAVKMVFRNNTETGNNVQIGADGSNLVALTGASERMRIDSSGNVIVGATSFNSGLTSFAQFEVSDSTAGGIVINTATAGANNYGRLLFTVANSTGNEGLIRYNTNDYHMSFWTNAAERMRIDSSGNVGVGTSSPDAPIEISRSNAGIIQYITNTGSGQAYTAYGNSDNPAWSQDFNTAGGLLVGIDSDETGVVYQGGNKALRFGTNAAERMRIDSAGVILQGSTSKTFGGIDATRLAVVGGSNSSSNAVQMIVDEDGSVEGGSTLLAVGFSSDNSFSTANYINFFDSGGQQGRIEGTGAGAVSYQSGSDERLKSNIRDTASKWDALKQIQVRDFEWTADTSNTTVTGFIAQELHNIFPDAVSEGGEDVTKNAWTVDYGRTTPIIIKALQEAITKIETLEAKVTALENA